MAFVAEIDAVGFFSLCEKIMQKFLIFVAAEGAEYSVNSPLITAEGAEEIPLSHLPPQ
jgi:uncharacterized protein (DUF2237 family)